MRKQDISIGTEYAVSRSNDIHSTWNRPSRVRVTGPVQTRGQGRPWDPTVNVFPVEYLDRETGESAGRASGFEPTRNFKVLWSEYAVANEARTESERLAKIRADEIHTKVWETNRLADDVLVALGAARQAVWVGSTNHRFAVAAGFASDDSGHILTALEVFGARGHGSVSADALVAAWEK